MKNPATPLLRTGILLAAAATAPVSVVHAADGTWVSPTGGNWTDTLNWSGGTLADGSGNMANFNSDISNPTTVSLNSVDRTVGNVAFSDNGMSGSAWTLSGNTLTLAVTSGTPTITTTTDTTINSVLAGTSGFIKAGAGTLTLTPGSGVTYSISGGITLNEGRVVLDKINHTSNIQLINSANTLTLGGGTLEIKGKTGVTGSQAFAGVVINPGSSTIHANQNGTATTAFNTLNGFTRNVGGTLAFTNSGAGFSMTTTINTNGIIGGYATNQSNTWAVGSAAGANTSITGLASYTAPASSTATTNVDVIADATLAGTDGAANTLRFNTASTSTLTLSGVSTLTSGGILVTPAVSTNSTVITGGTSLAGAAGKDLIIHQNNTAAPLTIDSTITDNTSATGLTKSGAGTLVLSGTNNYTGSTFANAGTLLFAKQVSLYNNTGGSWTDTNLIVNSGGTAGFNVGGTGEFTIANIDSLKALGTATGGFRNGSAIALDTTNASGDFTYSSVIANTNGGANSIGFGKLGTGTLVLTGANSYTGATTVSNGTLRAGSNTALGINSAVTLANVADVTLDLNNFSHTIGSLAGVGTNGGDITLGSALLTTGGNNTSTSFGGNISGTSGGITKTGTGFFTLSGTNDYTGLTTVSAGTLQLGKASSFYNSTTGTVSPANAAKLIVNNAATAAFSVGGSSDFDATDIATLLTASTGGVGFKSGATLGLDTSNGSFEYGSILADTANGSLGLIKLGTKQLTLTAENTHSGKTVVAHSGAAVSSDVNAMILNCSTGASVPGNLQIGNSGTGFAVVHLGASQQIADTGVVSFVGASGSWSYFKMMGFNETVAGLSAAVNGVIENTEAEVSNTNVTLTVNNSADHSFTGFLRNKASGAGTGTLSLVKEGSGDQSLAGTLSYSGNTTINNGSLTVSGAGALTNTPAITVASGASLKLSGTANNQIQSAATTPSLIIDGTVEATTPRANTLYPITISLNNGTLTSSGGAGTAADGAVGQFGAYLVSGNRTITANGANNTISGNGGVGISSGFVLTISTPLASDACLISTTVGKGNSGTAGGLAKTGAGTATFTGANGYAGATTISGGTLLMNGTKTGTGAVTVQTGATLGGTGTVAGATTVQSGGTIAPGASAGTITFPTSVNIQSGATYAAEIASASSYDKIVTSGTLTVAGKIKVTLLGGYVPASGAVFDLADASSITGTPAFDFDFTAATLPGGMSWDTTSFGIDGTIKVTGGSDPYGSWATTNNVTEGKSGDDDKDGISNLLEFATAADPKNGGSGARVYPLVHMIGGQQVLTYTTAVRASAAFAPNGSKQQADKDGVRYLVEATDNFAAWNSVVVTELAPADAAAVQAALGAKLNGLDAAWQWHTFRTDGDLASDPADFIRLNVTEAP